MISTDLSKDFQKIMKAARAKDVSKALVFIFLLFFPLDLRQDLAIGIFIFGSCEMMEVFMLIKDHIMPMKNQLKISSGALMKTM